MMNDGGMNQQNRLARKCDLCNDTSVDGQYREVQGWEQVRSQGGANKIMLRTETGRLACSGCIMKMQRGISVTQRVLF
jgi:hypothetical protein